MIFLDIDGVLNHGPRYDVFVRPLLDQPHLIHNLQHVIDLTGAPIVVVSNWKAILPLIQIYVYLREAGLRFEAGGCTDFAASRGLEVQNFRFAHRHRGPYIVLDDAADYFPHQPRIQTLAHEGLTSEKAHEAVLLYVKGARSLPD